MEQVNQKFQEYFNKEFRANKSGEKVDVDFLKSCFERIFKFYKEKLFRNIPDFESHPFFKSCSINWKEESLDTEEENDKIDIDEDKQEENDTKEVINIDTEQHNGEISPKDTDIDTIFARYLSDIKNRTNKEYFHFVLKYLILFRYFINMFKKTILDTTNQDNVEEQFVFY